MCINISISIYIILYKYCLCIYVIPDDGLDGGAQLRRLAGGQRPQPLRNRLLLWGSGFRVQGAGCRVLGAGCRVLDAGFRVGG